MKKYRKILAVLLCSTMMTGMLGEVVGASTVSGVDITQETEVTEPESTETVSTEASTTELESTEMLSTEVPTTETPATEAPATETPVTETSVTETPATEAPITEIPTTETSHAPGEDSEIALPETNGADSTGSVDVEFEYEDSYIELEAGGTYKIPQPELEINQIFEDSSETDVTDAQVLAGMIYTSADPDVVTVSKDGTLHAIAANTTEGSTQVRITASYTDAEENTSEAYLYVNVYNTIKLNKTKQTIYVGDKSTTSLTATIHPVGATVTWTSSNESVASVNAKGELTAKKAGKTTITAKAAGVSATCQVTVKKPYISMKSKKTLYVGNKTTLGAVVKPAAKTTWKSSNKKIATVNSKGVVTPKKAGKVTITVKAHGITKKCVVTVKKPTVVMQSAAITAFKGSKVTLVASAKPSYALKWKSSNKKIATVNKNGVVTTKKTGKVTITAYVSGAKATCEVKVIKNPYSLNASSRTIVAGTSTSLHVKNLPTSAGVTYSIGNDWDIVNLSSEDGIATVRGQKAGTATLTATSQIYVNGSYVYWEDSCKLIVTDEGIDAQQFSLAKGNSRTLKVVNASLAYAAQYTDDAEEVTISSVQWTSSKPSVAVVNASTGLVQAVKKGSATITANVTYSNGTTARYTSSMRVSEPKMKSGTTLITRYNSKSIALSGTNDYSSITWKSSKKSVATVSGNGMVTGIKNGSAAITAVVDGKKLTCKVYVSNPTLKSDYSGLTPGGTAQIQLKGTSKKSKITYSSPNKSVARVSSKGKITAVGCGSVEIKVTADGKEMYYWVEVAPQAAWNACNKGYSIMNSSTYSQTYRMSQGYYDCSSLVFRSYDYNVALLGGSRSWAPTAAGMASYMAQTGKVLSYQALPVTQLLPGDIIFYGHEDNGRYLGIYHVSMYYGGGNRLEKPLRTYYEDYNIVMIARPVR